MMVTNSSASPGVVGEAERRAPIDPQTTTMQPPPRHAPAVRVIDVLIEVLLAALLVFLPAAYGAVDAWSEMIGVALGAAIALCLAVRIVIDPPAIAPLPAAVVVLFLAIAGFQLLPVPRALVSALSPATAQTKVDLLGDLPDADAAALAQLPLSFYPHATRHDLRVVLLVATVLAAVAISFRDPRRIRRLLATIAFIALIAAVLALAQDIAGTNKIYGLIDTGAPARSGTFANHSHFAQFMNLSLGAALGLLLARLYEPGDRRRKLWSAIWLGGTIVLALLAMCLSLSRGGIIALLVAGAFTFAVILMRRALRWLAPILIVLALCFLASLLYFGWDRVYQRMLIPNGAVEGRLLMVKDTAAIIRRFPLTGIGLGTFEWVYPAYNHTNEVNTASHLENEYVQSAAEMGWAGVALVLAFAVIVWRRYARAIGRGDSLGIAAIGLGYGLAAVMFHSLSDYGQHLPAVACMSAAVCGLLLNLGAPPRRRHRMPRAATVVVGVMMLLISAWSLAGAEGARRGEAQWSVARQLVRDMDQRAGATTSLDYADLVKAADAAVDLDPDDVHHRYWAAVYHWRAVARQRDPQTHRIVRNDQTIAEAQHVIALLNDARLRCPTYAPPYAILGQIEFNFFDRAVGATHIHTAARLDPNDPTTCYLAGEVDARRGRDDAAVPMLRRAVVLDQDTSIDDEVNDLALDELGRPELAIAVAEGNWRHMVKLAKALEPPSKFAELRDRVLRRAVELLEQRCQDPGTDDFTLAQLCGKLMELRRYADADRYISRAIRVNPWNVDLRIMRGDVLVGLGRWDDAISEVRAATQIFPNSRAQSVLESFIRQRDNAAAMAKAATAPSNK